MKLWQRTVMYITLSTAILVSILAVKWDNQVKALCPYGYCCINDVFTAESSTGTEVVIVYTTCGSFSVSIYTDGVVIVSVCPTGEGCSFIYL